ncbi:hypothetical protein [Actinoplanes lutulentus]|uniref:hypothetical protein n=1 Tax=Actinoplanes lutulentus TaxID=1287878 RepID=UPI001FE6EA41|nr:hypothetical protein [Actinoplanes lutulentus]
MQSFLSAVPQAAAIWVTILLLLAIAVVGAKLPRAKAFVQPEPDENPYAAEVESAAAEAAEAAVRRRTEWSAAQEAVEATWAAYEEAELQTRRIAAATAFPLMSRRRKPGDNIDRQRYLHRAATELCRTQDLSIAQLNDVFAHRGWNPRLHPVQQEAVLHGAVRAHRLEAYRKAVAREQAAWRGAEAAAETLRDLRAEAASARLRGPASESADQQWWSEQWTGAELPAAA